MSLASYAAPFNEDNNNKSKMNPKIHTKKVSNLLNKIHSSFDEKSELADFVPPPMPKSSGVEKTIGRESFASRGTVPEYAQIYEEKPLMPPVQATQQMKPFNVSVNSKSNIEDKLNEIMLMLQEQKDEKTESVTEEIILYSFFGIFMIYLVDSFKRVGKYTR